MTEQKCGTELVSHNGQSSRQSGDAEEELHIIGSPGRDEMRKWTFTSLEVLVEQVQKRNLRPLEVLAEQKCGS